MLNPNDEANWVLSETGLSIDADGRLVGGRHRFTEPMDIGATYGEGEEESA